MGINNDLIPRPDAGEMLLRLARGEVDAAALSWLTTGLRAWIEGRGEIDVGRALGLPASPGRMTRNYWLHQAAGVLRDAGLGGDVSGPLAKEWSVFVSRGPWRRWHADGGPPDDASRLRSALYSATVASNGRTLCARQLRNVLGKFSGKNFPQQHASMPAWRLAPISEIDE